MIKNFSSRLPLFQVMELLVHLNKRIKSRPKIQLPVETLLVQYQDPAAVSFVTVSIVLDYFLTHSTFSSITFSRCYQYIGQPRISS